VNELASHDDDEVESALDAAGSTLGAFKGVPSHTDASPHPAVTPTPTSRSTTLSNASLLLRSPSTSSLVLSNAPSTSSFPSCNLSTAFKRPSSFSSTSSRRLDCLDEVR